MIFCTNVRAGCMVAPVPACQLSVCNLASVGAKGYIFISFLVEAAHRVQGTTPVSPDKRYGGCTTWPTDPPGPPEKGSHGPSTSVPHAPSQERRRSRPTPRLAPRLAQRHRPAGRRRACVPASGGAGRLPGAWTRPGPQPGRPGQPFARSARSGRGLDSAGLSGGARSAGMPGASTVWAGRPWP
jgi:hypothetical protein